MKYQLTEKLTEALTKFQPKVLYAVKGDTYKIKDELKAAGAKWNPEYRKWTFTEKPENYETEIIAPEVKHPLEAIKVMLMKIDNGDYNNIENEVKIRCEYPGNEEKFSNFAIHYIVEKPIGKIYLNKFEEQLNGDITLSL